MSDEHAELSKALVKACAKLTDIVAGRTASTGSYSYSYANIGDILQAVRPVLAEHGLCVMQDVTSDADGVVRVSTRLVHESGSMSAFGPLTFAAKGGPQAAGSAITYARRYQLLAALGLATEDDDGAAAQHARQSRPSQGHTAPSQRRPEPPRAPLHVDTIQGDDHARATIMAALNNAPENDRATVKRKFLDDVGASPTAVESSLLPFALQWCIDEALLTLDDTGYIDQPQLEVADVGTQ